MLDLINSLSWNFFLNGEEGFHHNSLSAFMLTYPTVVAHIYEAT